MKQEMSTEFRVRNFVRFVAVTVEMLRKLCYNVWEKAYIA